MDKIKAAFLIIGLAIVLVIIVGAVFGLRREGSEQISGTLTLWGVFDSPSVMGEILNDYRKSRPKVQISYRQLDPKNYESDLINALAGTQGPDLFMFHSSLLPKHYDKLAPLVGGLSIADFRNLFPTVVEQAFAPDSVIYALPLYIDTLALFYNKDSFDSAGIAAPPKTWLDFQNLIPKLREIDKSGRLIKMAAAIGGSEQTVNRSTDILNLLMLQSGIKMVDDGFSRATFAESGGVEALNFYTQFSDARGPYYTWNDNLPYSIDSFSEGKTAMMLNYSHQAVAIKDKNPFLNFAVAPAPQPSEAQKIVNFANYWGLAVSAKSSNSDAAWDFINFLTTNSDSARKYANLTGKPPALRSLIAAFNDHPDLRVFARQALTARSWPQIDNVALEKSFDLMIRNVLNSKTTADKAIRQSENEITQLMQKRLR